MTEVGIYTIQNRLDGKVYVGSSRNVRQRFAGHRHKLDGGHHSSVHLQRAWDKYGSGMFEFKIIEHCEEAELIAREQFYLESFNAADDHDGYNISHLAAYNEMTSAMRLKIAATLKGRTLPEWHRKRISDGLIGRKHSEATKAKMSATFMTRLPAMIALHTGRKRPAETGRKIAEANRKRSPQLRAQIAESNRHRSPESLRRLSEAIRLSWTDERRVQTSLRHKGMVYSEESRRKMSEAAKLRVTPEFRARMVELGKRVMTPEHQRKMQAAHPPMQRNSYGRFFRKIEHA